MLNPTTLVLKTGFLFFWRHSQKPYIETINSFLLDSIRIGKYYDCVFNTHCLASLFKSETYCMPSLEMKLLDLFQCIRAERLRKHMLLLCNNAVPMCVEVLLCPVCQCGTERAKNPEIANIPSPSDHLLEQWTVSVVHVR